MNSGRCFDGIYENGIFAHKLVINDLSDKFIEIRVEDPIEEYQDAVFYVVVPASAANNTEVSAGMLKLVKLNSLGVLDVSFAI